jgi:hypothetical protein
VHIVHCGHCSAVQCSAQWLRADTKVVLLGFLIRRCWCI